MKMHSLAVGLLAMSSVVAAQDTAPAAEGGTTVGVSIDASVLLGLGLSVGMPLGDSFNLRAAYHGYTLDEEIEDEGGNYDGEFKLSTFGLLGDWHPFGGGFRVTAGFMSNGNEIKLDGRANSAGQVKIGDCLFDTNPADPLNAGGTVEFNSSAPYLGIGWGGNMNGKPGFYGVADIGVMFSGSPKTSLFARGSGTVANDGTANDADCGPTGTAVTANDATVQDEIRDAENDANEESKDFKMWPNLSFGIGWRF